ncbi:MAG: permease [Bacteroidota bacterium]|nr:permease [Bacteroidota bacterium]
MENVSRFFMEFWMMICAMAPYLLLGFLIAGVLHVLVPKEFYRKYLTKNNSKSVFYAALLGIPLPLCSCGVIPTAIGLKNEKVSKGAVASFLIATPQTGIDSILATFSLMGLGFAIVRPVAALVTGVCGGLLVNRILRNERMEDNNTTCEIDSKKVNPIYAILRYAFFEMLQNIGGRLLIGLVLATLISIFIPDEFFLEFANYPLLQMLIILIIAIPMYVCSTGSIPIAASLILKGLSPGAALVMLMAGPAVNLASILVVKKSIGKKFTLIYVLTIVIGSILFGFLVNLFPDSFVAQMPQNATVDCCSVNTTHQVSWFKTTCAIIFSLLLINALVMKLFDRLRKKEKLASENMYKVEGMTCSHCKMAVEKAVMSLKNIDYAEADVNQKTLRVKGSATEKDIAKAVENAGFVFKGEV